MRVRSMLLLALCFSVTTVSEAQRRRAVWRDPAPAGPCQVQGLANFFYSTDRGLTWSQNASPATQVGIADLVVLDDEPERLIAVVAGGIFDSTDAGCTWTLRFTITEQIKHAIHIVAGSSGRAFIWNEEFALRYDNGVVTPLTIPQRIGGLGVNPGNREHVRILDVESGFARESLDGGLTWQSMGGAGAGGSLNSAAFDPSDFNHILVGVQTRGIMISRNGGRTWSAGASSSRAVCNMAFVPGRPEIVWATISTQGTTPFVMRSTDAGARLEAIAGFAGLTNGVCLAILPNPHDANSAIVPFVDFFTFDAAAKSVTASSCCGGRMGRIAYSLKDPARVYVYSSLK